MLKEKMTKNAQNENNVHKSIGNNSLYQSIQDQVVAEIANYPLHALGNGSASTPSLYFTSDTNTGIFHVGADDLGITTGGTQRMDISTTAITYTLPLLNSAGTASNPSVSFSTDSNTGIFSIGADDLGITTGGTQRLDISTSLITSTLPISVSANTASSSNSTGAILTAGGIASSNTTDATDSTNGGSLTLAGGLACAKKLFVGTSINASGNTASSSNSTGAILTAGGIASSNTTDASSSTNGGSLTLAGGLACAKKLFVGGGVSCLGAGNSAASSCTLYINPASTAMSGANNYRFVNIAQPTTSGSTSGNSYNLYIGPQTTTASANYSLYCDGTSYHSDIGVFAKTMGINATAVPFIVSPSQTALSGSNNYYGAYFLEANTTGSSSGTCSTVYINNSATNTGSSGLTYALNINAGESYLGAGIQVGSKVSIWTASPSPNIFYGTTAQGGVGAVEIKESSGTSAVPALMLVKTNNDNSTSQRYIQFYFNNTVASTAGSIVGNASNSIQFSTASDPRMKRNITPLKESNIDKFKNLNLYSYDFVPTGQRIDIGVMADEIQADFPESYIEDVSGPMDDAPIQGIGGVLTDATFLRLVKSFQEIISRVEALESA